MGFPLFWRASTPSIRNEDGHVPPDSIASLEMVSIGGVQQCVLIRGQSKKNPIILFLHGGPGMPSMYLAHRFQRPLEKDFVMVHWDRRGAGKTYTKDTRPESISVKQEIADTVELVNLLRSRFGQSKVYLVAHSYGTYLGMIVAQKFPELFHAYVGIGQLAYSEQRNRVIQDKWIREKAMETGNKKLLEQLDSKTPVDRETWLFRFGGELYHEKSFTALLSIGLRAPEYSLMDALEVRKGVSFTHKNMKYDAISGDLIDAVPRLLIPAYFFTGRHDFTDPFQYTEEYVLRLESPKKEIVWFEESAHFPFIEEPEKFAKEMRRVVLECPS